MRTGRGECVNPKSGALRLPPRLAFVLANTMVPRVRDNKKKRGRPATGTGTLVGVRLQDDLLSSIDFWRHEQDDRPGRPEAIRRLLEELLTSLQPLRQRSRKSASKASEMAGRELDRLGDQSLPNEERERRKRRLTKGPSEFRDMRDDVPK